MVAVGVGGRGVAVLVAVGRGVLVAVAVAVLVASVVKVGVGSGLKPEQALRASNMERARAMFLNFFITNLLPIFNDFSYIIPLRMISRLGRKVAILAGRMYMGLGQKQANKMTEGMHG